MQGLRSKFRAFCHVRGLSVRGGFSSIGSLWSILWGLGGMEARGGGWCSSCCAALLWGGVQFGVSFAVSPFAIVAVCLSINPAARCIFVKYFLVMVLGGLGVMLSNMCSVVAEP